jgi:hypothetical protein
MLDLKGSVRESSNSRRRSSETSASKCGDSLTARRSSRAQTSALKKDEWSGVQ